MNFRKLLMILGSLLIALLLWLIIRSVFFKDEVKPALADLIHVNRAIIELAETAGPELQTFPLQVINANLAAVVASDNRSLNDYFQDQYGKKFPKPTVEIKAVKEIEEANSGGNYELRYQELLTEYRTAADQLSQRLIEGSEAAALDQLLINYRQHLQTVLANNS